MEVPIFIVVVILLVVVLSLSSRFKSVERKLDQINKRITESNSDLTRKIEKSRFQSYEARQEHTKEPLAEPKPAPPTVQVEPKPKPEIIKPPVVPDKPKEEDKPKLVLQSRIKPTEKKQNVPVFETVGAKKQPVKKAAPKPKKPSFGERNPDLEKFIGENLASKIGIGLFVIGMGFLVKLGIDKGVINEHMRVLIGLVVGGGMIGLAHYLRKSFKTFSSILIGGGLAVLYFTIGLAHKEYDLFGGKTIPFALMTVVTIFSIVLSLAYDRIELAVIAIIGGFATPFIVSDGTGSHIDLFTYIMILDIGMLLLVYFKKWNLVNYLVFGFTYLLYVTVWQERYTIEFADQFRLGFFVSLTIFYLIFHLMSVIYNVRYNRKFNYGEISIMLANSAIYFALGLKLSNDYADGLYNGLFTALIGIFNAGFVFALYKRVNIDKTLIYLLVGLVLTFVSLIAPIQLKGNQITMFWAIEAVLLLWLAQKSEIKLIRLTAMVINVLMLFSLAMDWYKYYPVGHEHVLRVFINRVFITGAMVSASLFTTKLLLEQEERQWYLPKIEQKEYGLWVTVVALIASYFVGLLEINHQMMTYEYHSSHRIITLGIYTCLFILGMTIYAEVNKRQNFRLVTQILSMPMIASYVLFFIPNVVSVRNSYLIDEMTSYNGFILHYFLLILVILLICILMYQISKSHGLKSQLGKTALWCLSVFSVVVLSSEITHGVVLDQFGSYFAKAENLDGYMAIREINQMVIRTFYPVVWSISAFILMAFGMRYKIKTLRLASLALFLLTLLKLGLWDLRGISATGWVIALIVLGAILLVVSFLYQKLKFIVLDDSDDQKNPNV